MLLLHFCFRKGYCFGLVIHFFHLLQMSNLLESFIGYANGVSRSSQNLSSAAWAIFYPSGELVSFKGVCIGRSTNNITEYSTLIELLSDAITRGIC